MHVGEIYPDKKRLAGSGLTFDEVGGAASNVVVDCLHALFGQGTGVMDRLFADPAKTRVDGRVIGGAGLAVEHAARSEPLAKIWEIARVRVIRQFRLFLGVEVIEIAKKFIKTMHGRQVFVAFAEVVLAELSRRVAERL